MSAQDILVLAETNQDAVAGITLEMLGGARQLAAATGGRVVAVLLGPESARHADALKAADRILVVDDPALAGFSPEAYLAVLAGLVASEQPRAVLLGSTTTGLDLAPALGVKLNAPVLGGCQRIEARDGALLVTTSLCAGKLLADVRVDAAPAVLLILPGAFQAAGEEGQGQVETIPSPVALEPGAIRFEQMVLPEAGDVDITQQAVLVCVGRGIQQEANMELAEELAEVLGGAVCASRPIVDQGWLPTTRQVGKSGMIVKPSLYLALGLSGAPEHLEGMSGSELVIAVNTDPQAPIFDVAHFGVEMDLLDLVPPLIEAVKASKGGG